jgi:hypothetical protein
VSAVTELDWPTANQAVLAAEFRRLRAVLGDGDVAEADARLKAAVAELPAPSAIDTIAERFDLSGFERSVLLLVCGAEMDSALAAACGVASGRPGPDFGLALGALPEPHWSALAPQAPLRRWQLIMVEGDSVLVSARLRADERIVHYLGGLNQLDHRLTPLLRRIPAPSLIAGLHRAKAKDAAEVVRRRGHAARLVGLTGDDDDGQVDVAASASRFLGLTLFALRAEDIPLGAQERSSLATLWQRESALLRAALLIKAPAEPSGEAEQELLRSFAASIDTVVFVAGRFAVLDPVEFPHYQVDKPEVPEQRTLWLTALGERADELADTASSLAAQYRFSARRIAHMANRLQSTESMRDADRAAAVLHRLCRSDDHRLGSLAQHIDTRVSWEHLVLPEGPKRALRQVVVHARHRVTVQYEWGFAEHSHRGAGIATLFTGESGTGKTMAAEVLANELGADLFRVDLSAVVSKYIGETEKNLRRIFDAAEDSGALLLFDEADALFGKRSEVRDSHDRYANIEVSYLLQRMEAYRGLAILTTNNRKALDTAFQRRLRFVVHFPFPDVAQREAIWRVVFPPETPLGELDYPRLARLNATGGSIRNIALTAATLAAEDKGPVTMRHLLRATHSESAKGEKAPAEAEIRGWV